MIFVKVVKGFYAVRKVTAGLLGPKKLKRPNLAINSFKKGQILKDEKGPKFSSKVC